MSRRNCHPPHHESPHEQRLREIVDELVPDSPQKSAYLTFARELTAAERHKQLKRQAQAQAPDYSMRTKRVVMKHFRRGLHGNLLWRVGSAILRGT
jgi:hypothetical protein